MSAVATPLPRADRRLDQAHGGDLVELADAALYAAKRAGRNQING